MPVFQNSTVASDKLILGNCKMEYAATTVGSSYINVGAGRVTAWNHALVKYDTQAGNAPEPIEGIADETMTIDYELIEFDTSVISAIMSGATASSVATSVQTIHAGGNQVLTPRAFRFTNTRFNAAGVTVQTILAVYKGLPTDGPQISFKDDNDTDPIAVLSGSIIAKLDASRAKGKQLYYITTETS